MQAPWDMRSRLVSEPSRCAHISSRIWREQRPEIWKLCEITASVQLAACTSMPMDRSIVSAP